MKAGGVNPVSRLLQQPSQQIIGRFEDRRAHQHFPLGRRRSGWDLGLELANQTLDFFLLSQPDSRRTGFFKPAAMAARVFVMTWQAYSSVSVSKCW